MAYNPVLGCFRLWQNQLASLPLFATLLRAVFSAFLFCHLFYHQKGRGLRVVKLVKLVKQKSAKLIFCLARSLGSLVANEFYQFYQNNQYIQKNQFNHPECAGSKIEFWKNRLAKVVKQGGKVVKLKSEIRTIQPQHG